MVQGISGTQKVLYTTLLCYLLSMWVWLLTAAFADRVYWAQHPPVLVGRGSVDKRLAQ